MRTNQNTALPTKPSATVTVTRNGMHTVVRPQIEALRRDLFAVMPPTPPDDGVGIPQPLLHMIRPESPTGLVGYAGLEPVIVDWLRNHGHDVELTGERPAPAPKPKISSNHGADLAMLEFVRGQESGLIRYDASRVDPVRLAGQAIMAWRKATVVVTVESREMAWATGKMLSAYEPKTLAFIDSQPPAGRFRVIVADNSRLDEGALLLDRRDFWFALRPDQLFASPGVNFRKGFPRSGRCRLFGLMPLDVSPAPFQMTLLQSVYGVRETVVGQHGRFRRNANLVFLPSGAGPSPGRTAVRPEDLRRTAVWTHPGRNRQIGRLAELFERGETRAVRAEFPALKKISEARLSRRVMIRVDSLEQAEAILAILPGLPLVCDTPPAGATSSLPRVAAALADRNPGIQVRLAVGSAPFAGPPISILINAATIAPSIQPEAEAKFGQSPWNDELLVIDFQDDHHPLTRQWSLERATAGDAEGWEVAGVTLPSPWERFLAGRPPVDPAVLARAMGGI